MNYTPPLPSSVRKASLKKLYEYIQTHPNSSLYSQIWGKRISPATTWPALNWQRKYIYEQHTITLHIHTWFLAGTLNPGPNTATEANRCAGSQDSVSPFWPPYQIRHMHGRVHLSIHLGSFPPTSNWWKPFLLKFIFSSSPKIHINPFQWKDVQYVWKRNLK